MTACSDCNYGKGVKVVDNLPAPVSTPEPKTLEGLFGLELAQSEVSSALTIAEYQFKILRYLGGDRYLVQLFEYWFGEPTTLEVRKGLSNPEKFKLFATADQWRQANDAMIEREAKVFRASLSN